MVINYWLVVVVLIVCYLIYKIYYTINENDIATITDEWIERVINNDPNGVYNLFCNDGILLGTVSQTKRKGIQILNYFKYFTNLPNINVVSKKYNIVKVTNNVYINNAFIVWRWDDLDQDITARMTFVFRDKCLFLLHSSVLPELNKSLKQYD
jgi:hypothetical protein